jgi:hypothetical protein
MKQIIEWSKGNPGALQFLMLLLKPENTAIAIPILLTLEKLKSIRGTNIYVLWSDLCDQDLNKVEQLCKRCPDKILEDACSRQDYSGRNLVAIYLDNSVYLDDAL